MHGWFRGLSCKPNIYVSWSTYELRARLAHIEIGLSPPAKYFFWPFQGSTSFVDHLFYSCLVFVTFSRLFISALWSPEGKWLTSWLLFVMFIVILFFSQLVFCWLYRLLVLGVFLALMVCHSLLVKFQWRVGVSFWFFYCKFNIRMQVA